MRKRILSLILGMFFISAPTWASEGFSEAEEARIKALALQAILERPEILREAITILQRREELESQTAASRAIEERRDALENDPNAPVLGNPEGDVTLVEFFDYNCPYCKRAAEIVDELLRGDPDLKLVYREWPILGPGSVFATKAALAARNQDRYEDFHAALMSQPRVDETVTLAVAKSLGLDVEQLREDMESEDVQRHIAQSMSLARDLDITGTPAFIVGTQMIPGLVPLEQLQRLVEDVRTAAR